MRFITDEQTLADLNLLGKYKAGSMFNLFNRVKTRGGELLLECYFKQPLNSADLINKRAAQFKVLQEIEIGLELDGTDVEMASQYFLEGRKGNVLLSRLQCYKLRMQELLFHSELLNIEKTHIHSILTVLQGGRKLLNTLRERLSSEHPVKEMLTEIQAILTLPKLTHLKPDQSFKLSQLAYYRYLFGNKYKRKLNRLLDLLYEFDVLISVSQVGKFNGFEYAVAKTDTEELIFAENLRHPALRNAVGNNVELSRGENLMFLTGANMAGKSTLMKMLGVSFYLAHMGFPMAASSMRFKVMEGIFTSINVPDDISKGWSHFYAEVMRVKKVAEEVSSGKQLFILFDELFKGTNVKDAFDATLAVTEKLCRYKNCAFVISTHIIEVAEELKALQGIQFRFMPTVMNGTIPRYTYALKSGITSDRQGMTIIENEKILEIITGKDL